MIITNVFFVSRRVSVAFPQIFYKLSLLSVWTKSVFHSCKVDREWTTRQKL